MDVTIRDIEALTEPEAKTLALEELTIKGYSVYLIDFPGYFGYSACVFKNGKHIYYANDYELHHQGKTHEGLRAMYIKALNGKLFTEEELAEPLKSYDEYRAKANFLVNYYHMSQDYISCFRICHNEAEEKAYKESIAGLHLNPISFCYMADVEFIKHHAALKAKLDQRYSETENDFEYQKSAFLYEMYNHEYGINWQADYDVINCFDRVPYKDAGTEWYLSQTDFNDVQKNAYREAKREYFRREAEAC